MRLPFVAPPGWWIGARCRSESVPLSLFFSRDTVSDARDVCFSCPVRIRCLSEHIDEPFGVWGGHTRDERNKIAVRVGHGAAIGSASSEVHAPRSTGG